MPETDLSPLRRALMARHGPEAMSGGIDPALERSARISLPGAFPPREGTQAPESPDIAAQAIQERVEGIPEEGPSPRDEEALLIVKALSRRLESLSRIKPSSSFPGPGQTPPGSSIEPQSFPASAGASLSLGSLGA